MTQQRLSSHQQAEMLRLDMGMEGCGCTECQELYKTLDLSRYGSRVRYFQNTIIITSSSITRSVKGNELVNAWSVTTRGRIYRRRGQANNYDEIIDKAIAGGGSLRVIADSLKEKGISISHMTIARRKRVNEKYR